MGAIIESCYGNSQLENSKTHTQEIKTIDYEHRDDKETMRKWDCKGYRHPIIPERCWECGEEIVKEIRANFAKEAVEQCKQFKFCRKELDERKTTKQIARDNQMYNAGIDGIEVWLKHKASESSDAAEREEVQLIGKQLKVGTPSKVVKTNSKPEKPDSNAKSRVIK